MSTPTNTPPGHINANGEIPNEALSRRRGGFSTKIHVGVSGLGLPVNVVLTAGQASDIGSAPELIAGVPAEVVIGDKGYDSDALVEAVQARGAGAVIPPRSNRTIQRSYNAQRYKDRNLVERFFNKFKHFRWVAARNDKKAQNFLAFVHIPSIIVLLR